MSMHVAKMPIFSTQDLRLEYFGVIFHDFSSNNVFVQHDPIMASSRSDIFPGDVSRPPGACARSTRHRYSRGQGVPWLKPADICHQEPEPTNHNKHQQFRTKNKSRSLLQIWFNSRFVLPFEIQKIPVKAHVERHQGLRLH